MASAKLSWNGGAVTGGCRAIYGGSGGKVGIADTTYPNTVVTSAPVTIGSITTSGVNRLIIVLVGFSGPTADSVTGVTYTAGSGGAFFKVGSAASGGASVEAWASIGPSTGSVSVQVAAGSIPVNTDMSVFVYSLFNCDQTTGADTFASTAGVSATITMQGGDMAVAMNNIASNPDIPAGGNNRVNDATNVFDAGYAISHVDNIFDRFRSPGPAFHPGRGVTTMGRFYKTPQDTTIAVAPGVTVSPFFLLDYPNPMAPVYALNLRTFLNPIDLELLGQDQFFSAPGQGPTYDYPNPRGATPGITLTTWIDSTKVLLINQDQFFGAAGQGPANLDWPVPQSPRYASDLRTFLSPVKVQLIGKDQFFGAPGQVPTYVVPNPPGPKYASDLRTFVNPMELHLIGQDQFFGDPGQTPANLDWPVPKGTVPAISLRTWLDPWRLNLLNQDKFFGAAGQPPANLDWPLPPRGPIPASVLRTWLDPLKLALRGQDQFFGAAGQPPANLDWPLPSRGPVPALVLRTWLDALKLNLLGQDQFFGDPGQPPMYDYPNPLAPRYPSDLRTWTWMFAQILAVVAPFSQLDWPNPLSPRYPLDLRTWTYMFQQILAVVQSPFYLLDWPNPSGRLFPSDLRTFVDPLKLNLQGQDQFFGAPGQPLVYDYPNPATPRVALDLRTWISTFVQLLIAQAPFALLDWPNPTGRVPAIDLRSFLNPLEIQLLGLDQFFAAPGQAPVFDYPNPRAPQFSIHLRSLSNSLAILLPGPPIVNQGSINTDDRD